MPVTYQQLVEKVYDDRDACGEASRLEVEAIVRKAVEGVGLTIADTGEIVNPAPAVNPYHDQMRQQNVHWGGGTRRRRR